MKRGGFSTYLKGKKPTKSDLIVTWMDVLNFVTDALESLPSIDATQRRASRSYLPPIPEPICSLLLVTKPGSNCCRAQMEKMRKKEKESESPRAQLLPGRLANVAGAGALL